MSTTKSVTKFPGNTRTSSSGNKAVDQLTLPQGKGGLVFPWESGTQTPWGLLQVVVPQRIGQDQDPAQGRRKQTLPQGQQQERHRPCKSTRLQESWSTPLTRQWLALLTDSIFWNGRDVYMAPSGPWKKCLWRGWQRKKKCCRQHGATLKNTILLLIGCKPGMCLGISFLWNTRSVLYFFSTICYRSHSRNEATFEQAFQNLFEPSR